MAYPKGAAVPNASSLNFVAGDTRADLVTVPVSSDGWVSIRNAVGQTHVIADVQGYYVGSTTTTPAGAVYYFPDTPWRALDTRTDADVHALKPSTYVVQSVDYGHGDAEHQRSRDQRHGGPTRGQGLPQRLERRRKRDPEHLQPQLRGGPDDLQHGARPGHAQHRHRVARRSSTSPSATRAPATLDVIIDVVGVYSKGDGLRFRSAGSPKRIVDTRTGVGTTTLGAATTRTVTAPSTVANSSTIALVTNTTAVKPTAATYLTLWETGTTRSAASNLNPAAGQTVANMAMVGLSELYKFNIYNNAGTTDVIVDVAGRFDISPNLLGAPSTFSGRTAPSAATSQVAPLR